MTISKTITLANGVEMPRIGYGVFRMMKQQVLRQLEIGNIAIPKSVTPERIAENLAVFNFGLAVDEVAAITALNTFHRTGTDPDKGFNE